MESPYENRLGTNYAPTVGEARHIQKIVNEAANEIFHLNAQIDILREKKDKIQTFADRHQALLSPARQLTRDVLEEIFLACLPTDRYPCMSAIEAPMLLTRICSSWREIALSTPKMWAKIHIALPVVDLGIYDRHKDLILQQEQVIRILQLRESAVKEWLDRSHACPLSISIYQNGSWPHLSLSNEFYTICEELRKLHVSFIRNTIVPCHKRWRVLDLYAADDTLSGFLDIGLKAESLELLDSFHVARQTAHTPGRQLTLPHRWKEFVSLMPSQVTSMSFHNFPIRNSDISPNSLHSWSNLTELSLKLDEDPGTASSESPVNNVQLAAAILRNCHSLKTLGLIISSNSDVSLPLLQTDDIVLQHLTTLTIALPLNRDGLALAKLLYLPSLKDLGFQLFTGPGVLYINSDQELVRDIIRSILRANEDYHTLRIHAPYWASSFDDLVQLLKYTSALRHLDISSKQMNIGKWPSLYIHSPQNYFRDMVNDSLLKALMSTNRTDSDILCPKLEVLMIDNMLITDISETCLKDFLISRESDTRVPSLRRISVALTDPKLKQDLNTKKVSLGSDSAVYFRKEPSYEFSPFEGIEDDSVNTVGAVPMDCYNEL